MRFWNNEAFIFLRRRKMCTTLDNEKCVFYQETLFNDILNRFEKQKKSLNPEKPDKFFKIQAILLL